MSITAILCENIRRARLKGGWTQEAVSEKAGLSPRHFQDIENHRRPGIRLETVQRIANALEVEPWQLFRQNEFPKPEAQRGRSV